MVGRVKVDIGRKGGGISLCEARCRSLLEAQSLSLLLFVGCRLLKSHCFSISLEHSLKKGASYARILLFI